MASEGSKHLQRALAGPLKALGFKKSGATWHRPTPDAIAVLNLQGSQFGPSFYVNLGVYFRALGDRVAPPESLCHLRIRLSQLVPNGARLTQLLDLESPIAEPARLQELVALVREFAAPWLDQVSTRKGARLWCSSPRSESFFLGVEARSLLELVPGA